MRRTAQLATMFALLGIGHTAAQQAQLQLNTPVERALDPKDAGHEFAVTTKGNQAFTITVQQQGIDIVVAVLGPDGKKVVEVDNASEQYGMGGSEIAHVAGLSPGEYRVRVTPFVRDDAKAAKYTIALTECAISHSSSGRMLRVRRTSTSWKINGSARVTSWISRL